MQIMSDQPTTACRRPCHDCPFRSDIVAYQSRDDVTRNLEALLRPERVAVCHQTSKALTGREQEKACAGFLLMCQALGLPNRWLESNPDEMPRAGTPTHASLKDFFYNSACADQSAFGRFLAWLLNQPKTKRAKIEDELFSNPPRYETSPAQSATPQSGGSAPHADR